MQWGGAVIGKKQAESPQIKSKLYLDNWTDSMHRN